MMKCLYLIVFDENLPDSTHLQNAIKRYLKYFATMDIDVKVFGRLKCSESLLCLEGTSSCSEISFQFISFKEIMYKVFQKVFDFSDINSLQVYLWKEKIKHLIYYDIVQQFKHGAKSDLVNSELGLLNVCCINKIFDLVDNKLLKSCDELLTRIDSEFNIENDYQQTLPELMLIKFYVKQIRQVLKEFQFQDNLDIIKNNFIQICNFVSKYKTEQDAKNPIY